MADEVTDASNREQIAVCLRWLSDDFEPHEDFMVSSRLNQSKLTWYLLC